MLPSHRGTVFHSTNMHHTTAGTCLTKHLHSASQMPVTELSVPRREEWALPSTRQRMLLRTHQVPPAQSHVLFHRYTYSSWLCLKGLLQLPDTGWINLGWFLPCRRRAATKTTPASLELAYIHNTHTALNKLTALPTIENTESNQQMAHLPLTNCFQFWLPKLKDPAEREGVERQLVCYQVPRQFGMKRDREVTVFKRLFVA